MIFDMDIRMLFAGSKNAGWGKKNMETSFDPILLVFFGGFDIFFSYLFFAELKSV